LIWKRWPLRKVQVKRSMQKKSEQQSAVPRGLVKSGPIGAGSEQPIQAIVQTDLQQAVHEENN
jgi:hypothetical protein